MEKVLFAMVAAFVIAFVIALFAIVGTAFGALGGWIVGLLFGETIIAVWTALGFAPVAVWQIGAFFGFIGGFFRAVQTSKSD